MLDELLAQLAGNDRYAQMRAARALGELGDARAVEPLLHALAHGDEWVATEAAQALGRLRAPEAVPALLETPRAWQKWFDDFVLPGEGPHAAYAAAGVAIDLTALTVACYRALGQIGDARAVPGLIAALDDKHLTNEPKAAAEALLAIGTEEARAAVERAQSR